MWLVLTRTRDRLTHLIDSAATVATAGARPDTPARLEVALAAAMELLGDAGRPRVTRRPPGLYTPEAWQVRVTSIDPAVSDAIRGAARGLGFSR